MKNRDGYVSIIAIIVMSVSMIMILQISTLVKMQLMILNSNVNKIQSYYWAEDKILLSLYDEKYYTEQFHPILLDVFRKNDFETRSKEIIINQKDLDKHDSCKSVKLIFQDQSSKDECKRKIMMLTSQSNYKDISTSVRARTSLVNRLFEMEETILDINTVEDECKDELETLLMNIEKNITSKNIDNLELLYRSELCEFNSILLKSLDNKIHKLICTRDTMETPYIEAFDKKEVFIVIKKLKNEKTTLFIDGKENLIKLSGIIYIEGDLLISGDFIFSGIIIIKDGKIKVESDVNPKINGMLIISNSNESEEIGQVLNIEYNRFLVYKYGILIPGFLDININSIKNGK